MFKNNLKIINFLLPLFFITCSHVKRVDVKEIIDLSGRWNDTDSRLVAEEIVNDLIIKPWRNNFLNKNGKLPVVLVGEILNKSHEHIDAGTFINDIERESINSSSIKIIANNNFREKVRKERIEQNSIDNKIIGKELGADFMMFGSINTIVDSKYNGKKQVIYYQVDLELIDLTNNEIVWMGSKKIKKFLKK